MNEHRTIVVLFVAFEPFAYEEPEAAAELQEYFARVVATIARFDGHLRQIDVGDKGSKYIVLFGAPIAHENDPERALRCALELQRLRGARTAGIGIAAGLTYCGVVGAPTRREYAAVGDTVNLAARLMQAAGQGRILVTGLADGRLDAFQVGTMLALTVKGKPPSRSPRSSSKGWHQPGGWDYSKGERTGCPSSGARPSSGELETD